MQTSNPESNTNTSLVLNKLLLMIPVAICWNCSVPEASLNLNNFFWPVLSFSESRSWPPCVMSTTARYAYTSSAVRIGPFPPKLSQKSALSSPSLRLIISGLEPRDALNEVANSPPFLRSKKLEERPIQTKITSFVSSTKTSPLPM